MVPEGQQTIAGTRAHVWGGNIQAENKGTRRHNAKKVATSAKTQAGPGQGLSTLSPVWSSQRLQPGPHKLPGWLMTELLWLPP